MKERECAHLQKKTKNNTNNTERKRQNQKLHNKYPESLIQSLNLFKSIRNRNTKKHHLETSKKRSEGPVAQQGQSTGLLSKQSFAQRPGGPGFNSRRARHNRTVSARAFCPSSILILNSFCTNHFLRILHV